MESALKRDLRNYPLYFLIWTIIGIFFFSRALSQKFFSRDPTPLSRYLISWLVGVYLWALLMPGSGLAAAFPSNGEDSGVLRNPRFMGQSGCRTWIRDRCFIGRARSLASSSPGGTPRWWP